MIFFTDNALCWNENFERLSEAEQLKVLDEFAREMGLSPPGARDGESQVRRRSAIEVARSRGWRLIRGGKE